MKCVLDKMDVSQELYVKTAFNLTGDKESQEFFDGFYSKMIRLDCVQNYSNSILSDTMIHFSLEVFDPGCAIANNCPVPVCEDGSCLIPQETCLTWCRYKDWIPSSPVSEVYL